MWKRLSFRLLEFKILINFTPDFLEEIKKLKLMRSVSTLSNGSANTDHASPHKFSRQFSRQSQTSLKKEKQESVIRNLNAR